VLLKEAASKQQHIGYAFFEYLDSSVTDQAIEGLTGLAIGKEALKLERASQSVASALDSALVPEASLINILAGLKPGDNKPTKVLQLLNIFSRDALEQDAEYQSILADVRLECETFGTVVSVQAPRPIESQQVPGTGRLFIEFEDAKQAESAATGLGGRRYDGRVVLACYYPEEKYLAKEYN
jgi:splicing factor U2AF subunit